MISANEQPENAPLLREEVDSYGSGSNSGSIQETLKRKRCTPLPWKQLMTVFFLRLAEPIAYTQVFPVGVLL